MNYEVFYLPCNHQTCVAKIKLYFKYDVQSFHYTTLHKPRRMCWTWLGRFTFTSMFAAS